MFGGRGSAPGEAPALITRAYYGMSWRRRDEEPGGSTPAPASLIASVPDYEDKSATAPPGVQYLDCGTHSVRPCLGIGRQLDLPGSLPVMMEVEAKFEGNTSCQANLK